MQFNTPEERHTEILKHLGLVRMILSRYYKYADLKEEGNDLYEQGMIGLCMAVDKYNPYKGMKFSAFASWYIRMYINLATKKNIKKHNNESVQDDVFWKYVSNTQSSKDNQKEEDEDSDIVKYILSMIKKEFGRNKLKLFKKKMGLDGEMTTVMSLDRLAIEYNTTSYYISKTIRMIKIYIIENFKL